MPRSIRFMAAVALTLLAAACADHSNKVASKPKKTYYRAYNTQVGSNIPRTYNAPPDEDTVGSPGADVAGGHSFVNSAAGGPAAH